MPRENWTWADGYTMRFSCWPWNNRLNFHSPTIFEKSWENAKDVYACFVEIVKEHDRVHQENHWGISQMYGVDDHLLPVIKSLYSCSKVCVRATSKKSQTFAV